MRKLKEKLNAKLSKNGGFTLVEMLIVVAIIAILIAVSIPLVNGALEKARHATDDANYRNAVALADLKILTTDDPTTLVGTGVNPYWYVVDTTTNTQGSLTQAATAPDSAVESKCTEDSRTDGTKSSKGKNIKVTFESDATEGVKAKVEWS